MDYLIVVDSLNGLDEKFVPMLESVGKAKLEKRVAHHCRRMISKAAEDGVEIKLLSGYRSAEYQKSLWDRSVSEYMAAGADRSAAEEMTARYLARAGHSEHQTGLACDFCSPDWDDTQDDFFRTEQGRWLCANAAEYGFILRYPRMKEHITGIAYEPWHYRFVGNPHAKIIRAQGLTLEEYLYYYGSLKYICKKNPHKE